MSETDIKILAAVITALVSLVLAAVTHFSARTTQRELEALRDVYAENRAERDARRDYRYEARKRLYHECSPLLFQISELSEAAYFRVTGLARTARLGNLEPGPASHLRDSYYRVSTLHRILAPSAAMKLLQKRLGLVDLSLDPGVHQRYVLLRQAFLAFGDEFAFAHLGPSALPYEPLAAGASRKAKANQSVYYRQGLPLGVMEHAIEALIANDSSGSARVMTYAECEMAYQDEESRVRQSFDDIMFLIEDFHPRTRPVLWRMMVAQALIYRALSEPGDFITEPVQRLFQPNLQQEFALFDWRTEHDKAVSDEEILAPLRTAVQYMHERLSPRLARVARPGEA